VQPPRFDADYLDNPAPAYPALSRRMGEQGRVLLRVYVLADGNAGQVEIRESSGYERLDRAARDTVARWRFVPARQGDKAVAGWVLVPVSFSLRS
jgi:protein TonB